MITPTHFSRIIMAQAKVLRALEEGTIERVGGSKLTPVDVRVIAATNKDLEVQIQKSLFRDDLYHRLRVIPIHVPPLRERREDIPVLVTAFVEEICQKNGIAGKTVSKTTMGILSERPWSGNVRELRNVVERLVILSPGSELDPALLEMPQPPAGAASDELSTMGGTFQEFKERAEAAYIKRQLERHHWNISKTAEALDIQRSHLYTKMKRYGLAKGGADDEGDS